VFVFGVGAIQTGISPFWHSLCAYGTFIGINIYISISTWIMDTLVQQKDLSYRRGYLRIVSSVGGPLMFCVHITPLTRGFSSSLAEIGLLICFLLWVASQYGAWGNIYLTYDENPKSSKEAISMSEWVGLKYKRLSSNEDFVEAERRNNYIMVTPGEFFARLERVTIPGIQFVEKDV